MFDKVMKGSRLSPEWRPAVEQWNYASGLGFDVSTVERIAEDFRDYWIACAGQRGTKMDWSATWRVWCRREADKRRPNGHGGGGTPGGGNRGDTAIDIANSLSLDLRAR